jgi:hypothetical protein
MARHHFAFAEMRLQTAAAKKVTPNATIPGHTRLRSNGDNSRQYVSNGARCARSIDSRNPYLATARNWTYVRAKMLTVNDAKKNAIQPVRINSMPI